jgi:hypothetical protein
MEQGGVRLVYVCVWVDFQGAWVGKMGSCLGRTPHVGHASCVRRSRIMICSVEKHVTSGPYLSVLKTDPHASRIQ